MKLIPLSQQGKYKGKFFAQVDDADFDYLNQWKWCAKVDKRTIYAIRSGGVFMQRQILNTPSDKTIDHKDRNGLNNQRNNLRECTRSQNAAWTIPRGKSKYKGVICNKKKNTFTACLKINYKAIILGVFKTEIEAAKAYDRGAKIYHGEFAFQNFQ